MSLSLEGKRTILKFLLAWGEGSLKTFVWAAGTGSLQAELDLRPWEGAVIGDVSTICPLSVCGPSVISGLIANPSRVQLVLEPQNRVWLIQKGLDTGATLHPALRASATVQQPPQANAELDVASAIAMVQEPSLRREMLFNLSEQQILTLPAGLRHEYETAR